MSQSEYWAKFMERRLSRRRLLQAGVVTSAGVVVGSALGCGGSNSEPTATTKPAGAVGSTPGATSVPTSTAGQPKPGGSVTVRQDFDPRGFDVHLETQAQAGVFVTRAYNGLVKFNPESTKVIPDLAASWETPDETTYIFKLNQGVKFHNVEPANGRELTAEDIKYSIERQMTDSPGKFNHAYFFLGLLSKIDVVDKYTVKFATTQPYAPFLNYLASPWTKIVNKEAVEKHKELTTVMVGTGPFILKEHTKNVEARFVKNPDYFKKGKPYLDEIRVRFVPDESTVTSMVLGGEFDVSYIPFNDVDRVKKAKTNYQFIDQVSIYPFILRTAPYDDKRPHKEPFKDIRIRKAIQLATDKSEYINAVYGGNGIQMVGMIAPAQKKWALPESAQIKQDIAKAKQLMAEAGFEKGFKTDIICTQAQSATDCAQVAKGQLAKIGIDAEVKIIETAQYYTKVYGFDYNLNLHNMLGSEEPEEYLMPYYGEKATFYRWGDAAIKKKLDEQRLLVKDEPKRIQLIQEIQMMVQDQAPMVPLFVATYVVAAHPKVKGLNIAWNQYDASYWEDVWVSA